MFYGMMDMKDKTMGAGDSVQSQYCSLSLFVVQSVQYKNSEVKSEGKTVRYRCVTKTTRSIAIPDDTINIMVISEG